MQIVSVRAMAYLAANLDSHMFLTSLCIVQQQVTFYKKYTYALLRDSMN